MAPLCIEEGDAAFYSGEEESSTTLSSINGSSLTSSRTGEESLSLTMTPLVRRSVSFSPGAAVHLDAVMNIDDYSEAEKFDCWYQVDEMREIRREVKETVALMNRNIPVDQLTNISAQMNDDGIEMTISTHGLEGKTRVGKRHRKETRLASLAAVFDEQTLQEMDGMCDPSMIAIAYIEYSYPMQVAAFQRAAKCQTEAASIYLSSKKKGDHQASPDKKFADTNGSVVAEATVNPIQSEFNLYQPTLSSQNYIELEKGEDEFARAFSVSNDKASSSEFTADKTHNNTAENDNAEFLEVGVDRPYLVGPLRIRDRFACLLPGSASNSTRSLMGAFRVVQI